MAVIDEMLPVWRSCSDRGEELMRRRQTAQLKATERHDAIKRRGQFPTDDDWLAERFGRVLNAAHQIDRGPMTVKSSRSAAPILP